MRSLRAADFWSGIMFGAFGMTAIYMAQSYPLGSAAHMGPAWFPIILGLLLIAIGGVLTLQGLQAGASTIEAPVYRPLVILLLAVTAFGLTIDRFGLLISSALLIYGARMAAPDFQFKATLEIMILAAVLIIFSSLLFVYGLGLPFKILPV